MQKKIIFEKGALIIGYCDNSQDTSVYRSGEYTEPIRFTFFPNPNIQMTEEVCIEYTNQIMPRIIKEAQDVISTNNEFYQNFDIDLNSNFSGFNLHKHSLNRDLLIVSKSWMYINCNLKESEVILSHEVR